MAVDESPLELIVLESIKAASEKAKAVIARRETERYKMVSHGAITLAQNERIGIFVTCLRTELISRESKVPHELQREYESAKIDMCRTDNWTDVGVFGTGEWGIRQTASGRWKRTRVFSPGPRPGYPDIDDILEGYTFNAAHRTAQSQISSTPGTGRSLAAEAMIEMDKSRIGALAAQAKQENTGFDFNASFASMEQMVRDMNLMAKRHESLGGQAEQVTEGLCAVAESLVVG